VLSLAGWTRDPILTSYLRWLRLTLVLLEFHLLQQQRHTVRALIMPIETGLGGGLVSVTSTNVGPLTSTFTPASSCSNLHLHYIRPSNSVDQASQVWLYGNQCLGLTKTVPSNCLPSDYVSIYNSLGDAHDRTYPVMSPGYGCPVGYEPSCTMMQIPPATTGLTRAWRVLAQNETAIGCCPR
jgi:hypothetical protein